ncbi:hypothetical protein ZIOFF_050663 [Zingiber officinale]|uniref:Leucine-rich repeat-containing N-terminal plant-type domain-containing protein n=1 Tax=Zingiber officinale TaxID=94328 RepID=A0A8J5KQJ2_ZINOF|nr:hypothetical protein ZIOFF_050663 [Zingiber officinale]
MARMRGRGIVAIWVLLACVCARYPSFVVADTDSNDASALNVLFNSLNSNSQLTGWKQNGGDPCGESWRGITCSGSSITAITLSGLGLTGTLGYNMNQLSSLTELDLSKNNLGNGVQIPYTLPTNLHKLDLSNNQFGQTVPYIISQMTSLEYLDLSFNSFSGDLPQSSSSLTSLTNLYLQNNQFTGHIDVLANLPLQNLTGNNQWSSGPAPPPPPYSPPPPGRKSDPGQQSGHGGIGGGGIAGIIISILVVGGIVAFFVIRRKSRNYSVEENLNQDQPFAHLAPEEVNDMKMMQTPPRIDTERLSSPAPISLKPPPLDRYRSSDEDDVSNKSIAKRVITTSVKAVNYSVADLQVATDSFSEDNLVGEGSYGRVYKAQFNNGKVFT